MRPTRAPSRCQVRLGPVDSARARGGRDDRVFWHHAEERTPRGDGAAVGGGLRHARAEGAAPTSSPCEYAGLGTVAGAEGVPAGLRTAYAPASPVAGAHAVRVG